MGPEDPEQRAAREVDQKARGAGILFASPAGLEDRPEVRTAGGVSRRRTVQRCAGPLRLRRSELAGSQERVSGRQGRGQARRLPRRRPAAPAEPLRDQSRHGPSGRPHHGHQQRLAGPGRRAGPRARLRHGVGQHPARPAGQSSHRAVRLDGRVGAGAGAALLEPARLAERRLDGSAVHAGGRSEGRGGPGRRGRRALVAHLEGRGVSPRCFR